MIMSHPLTCSILGRQLRDEKGIAVADARRADLNDWLAHKVRPIICEVALYNAWRVLNVLKPAIIRPVDHAIVAAEPTDAAPSKPSKVRAWLGREEELARAWVHGASCASVTEASRSKLPSLGTTAWIVAIVLIAAYLLMTFPMTYPSVHNAEEKAARTQRTPGPRVPATVDQAGPQCMSGTLPREEGCCAFSPNFAM